MICPECGEVLKDDAVECKNCGASVDLLPNINSQPKKTASLKSKIIFIAIIVVFAIVAVVLLVLLFTSDKGQKTAEKLAKGIGEPLDEVSDKIDYSLTKQSSYEFLNNLTQFSHMCTSEDEINVEGIDVPEWAVYCVTDGDEEIVSVKLYDFTKLEDSWKGVEENKGVEVNKIHDNMSLKDFEDIVDIKPYIISYSDSQTVYEYRYFYEDVDKNQTCHLMKAVFDSDDELLNFESYETDFSQVIFGNYDMLCNGAE